MHQPKSSIGGVDCTFVWGSQRGITGTFAHTLSVPASNSIPTTSPLNIAPGNYLPGLRLKEDFSPISAVTSFSVPNDEHLKVSTLVAPPLTKDIKKSYTLDSIPLSNQAVATPGASLGSLNSESLAYTNTFNRTPAKTETFASLSLLNNFNDIYLKISRSGSNYNGSISLSPNSIGGAAKIEVLRNGKTSKQIRSLLGVPTGPTPQAMAAQEFLQDQEIGVMSEVLPPSLREPEKFERTVLQHYHGELGTRANASSSLAFPSLALGVEYECSSQLNMFVYSGNFTSASRRTRILASFGPIPGMVSAALYKDLGDGWAAGVQTARLPSINLPGVKVKSSHASTLLVSKSVFPSANEMESFSSSCGLSGESFQATNGFAVAPKSVIGFGLQTTGDVLLQTVYQYSPTIKLNTLVTATGLLKPTSHKGLEIQTSITYE